MDLAKLRLIAPKIDADLDAVFAKYGLKVRQRRASTDPTTGTVKWSITTNDTNQRGKDGALTTPERELFKECARMYDLQPEWLDKSITLNGTDYKIVGLRKVRKNNVSLTRADGKAFTCSAEQVRRALGSTED